MSANRLASSEPGRAGQGELGAVGQAVGGDPREHRAEGGALHRQHQRQRLGHEQPPQEVPVLRVGGVVERLERLALVAEPARGPAVQLGNGVRRLDREPVAQRLAQQCVVAEPGTVGTQADDEGVRRGELLEALLPPRLAAQLLGERGVEPLGDRRAQQELLHLRVVAGQHLLGEVLDDGVVVAAEVGGPVSRLVAGEEERRQPQPGRPPLGALDEQLGVAGPEHHAVAAQERRRVGGGEGEVGRADLPERTGDPQPVQRQRRVGPGEQHEAELGNGSPHEGGHRGEHGRVVDQVEVVEHEHDRLGQLGEPRHQPAEDLVLAAEPRHQVGQRVVRCHRPRARAGRPTT